MILGTGKRPFNGKNNRSSDCCRLIFRGAPNRVRWELVAVRSREISSGLVAARACGLFVECSDVQLNISGEPSEATSQTTPYSVETSSNCPAGAPHRAPGEGLLPDPPMQGTAPVCKKQFLKICLGRFGRRGGGVISIGVAC